MSVCCVCVDYMSVCYEGRKYTIANDFPKKVRRSFKPLPSVAAAVEKYTMTLAAIPSSTSRCYQSFWTAPAGTLRNPDRGSISHQNRCSSLPTSDSDSNPDPSRKLPPSNHQHPGSSANDSCSKPVVTVRRTLSSASRPRDDRDRGIASSARLRNLRRAKALYRKALLHA